MAEVRLIDANALACKIAGEYFSKQNPSSVLTEQGMEIANAALDMARIKIREAPTIDAVPVVHGRWEYNTGDNIPYCNQCCMPQDVPTNYCHNCGAKMDGGASNV